MEDAWALHDWDFADRRGLVVVGQGHKVGANALVVVSVRLPAVALARSAGRARVVLGEPSKHGAVSWKMTPTTCPVAAYDSGNPLKRNDRI